MSLDNKSILVTGGAGFVGSCLVNTLARTAKDSQIVVVDNLINGRLDNLQKTAAVEVRQVDLRNGERVQQTIEEFRPEIVFHLGALHFIPYCNAHPVETMEVNVIGTQHVLEACRKHAPRKIVIASTAAVYPIRDAANREDDAVGPMDIYGLSKLTNERQLELYARQTDTHCAAARLFNVYGPNETNPHVIPEILEQMGRGKPDVELGNVKPKRDYVYVTDVAQGLIAMAERNDHSFRVYNVGTGSEYSVEEIVERLSRLSELPLRIRVASERVRKAERMHLLCDNRRIERELGWRPQHTIDSGLRDLWLTFVQDRQIHAKAS